MKKLLCLTLFFVGSVFCIPSDGLIDAIRASNYDEVKRITQAMCLSSELERVALIELANDVVILRQHDLDSQRPKKDSGCGLRIELAIFTVVNGISFSTAIALTNARLKPIAEAISYCAGMVAGRLAIQALVAGWRYKKQCAEYSDVKTAYDNALKIKHLLYYVPVSGAISLNSEHIA